MDVFSIINDIISQTAANFDFGYMIIVNVLTYFVIKCWDELNGDKQIGVWQKRAVLLVCIVVVTAVYLIANYPNIIILINSSILAPVFWSWIARPILVKFGFGYKQSKLKSMEDDVIGTDEPVGGGDGTGTGDGTGGEYVDNGSGSHGNGDQGSIEEPVDGRPVIGVGNGPLKP